MIVRDTIAVNDSSAVADSLTVSDSLELKGSAPKPKPVVSDTLLKKMRKLTGAQGLKSRQTVRPERPVSKKED
jgi:hypothetical protein